jgi:hypothetical protein
MNRTVLTKVAVAGTCIATGIIFGPEATRRLEARLFAMGSMAFAEIADQQKARHFSSLATLASEVRMNTSKNEGPRIAELGVGVGVNFKYYPPGTVLVAVDPNPLYEGLFWKNAGLHPDVMAEKYIIGQYNA